MARYVHQLTTIAITGRQVEASTWWRGLETLLTPSPHGDSSDDDLVTPAWLQVLQNHSTAVFADSRDAFTLLHPPPWKAPLKTPASPLRLGRHP